MTQTAHNLASMFLVVILLAPLQQDDNPNNYNCQIPTYAEQHAADCNSINNPFLLGGGTPASTGGHGGSGGGGGGLLGVIGRLI
jgi:hypothetical protein